MEPESYFEVERVVYDRDGVLLEVSFVSDLGAGYTGPKSLEEAIVHLPKRGEARLWLHRTRNSKWRAELIKWAEAIANEWAAA